MHQQKKKKKKKNRKWKMKIKRKISQPLYLKILSNKESTSHIPQQNISSISHLVQLDPHRL